jgi:hypothetical protein
MPEAAGAAAGSAGAGAGAGAGAVPPQAASARTIMSDSRIDEIALAFFICTLLCHSISNVAYVFIIRERGEKQQERKLTFH